MDHTYPGTCLPSAAVAIHQPAAGIVHADRALAAFLGAGRSRGVVVHEGVEVARQAADLVLAYDDLVTLVSALEEVGAYTRTFGGSWCSAYPEEPRSSW